MLTLKSTGKFKRDYKRMKSQGKDMSVLQDVIDTLLMEKPLDIKHHDHSLSGKYIWFSGMPHNAQLVINLRNRLQTTDIDGYPYRHSQRSV